MPINELVFAFPRQCPSFVRVYSWRKKWITDSTSETESTRTRPSHPPHPPTAPGTTCHPYEILAPQRLPTSPNPPLLSIYSFGDIDFEISRILQDLLFICISLLYPLARVSVDFLFGMRCSPFSRGTAMWPGCGVRTHFIKPGLLHAVAEQWGKHSPSRHRITNALLRLVIVRRRFVF